MRTSGPRAQPPVRTLIVDDDPYLRESLREILEHDGYVALEAGDGKTALDLLDQEAVDLLLLDLQLPRVSGVQVLEQLVERRLDIPVVIISGTGNIPEAVRTMKLGAYDYIEKPPDAQRVLQSVRAAVDKVAKRRRADRSLTDAWATYHMIGLSPSMQSVYEAIDRAAKTHAKVLIVGESGTGKELVASAIHTNGSRAAEPFVTVNCAAIPETLIESELFGHTEGAFTGARSKRKGKFEIATRGSLFLDEIGDMSLMTQAKVLRALESGEIQPVGSERTFEVHPRIIAATNKNLAIEIEEGNFREDLYYRLSVVVVNMPALRERREDIPPLVTHFFQRLRNENDSAAKEITPTAVSVLTDYHWPGNIRELSNVVERLVVFSEKASIDANDARAAIERHERREEEAHVAGLREARDQFEKQFITTSLNAHGGRIQETADSLGINRTYLWKKMKHLGIQAQR